MNDVRLPRLLDQSMGDVDRLHPLRLSVQLSIRPLSNASMTLSENDHDVKLHDFIELYSLDGSIGVYRVASVQQNHGTDRRIILEHGIVTLQDALSPAEASWSGSMRDILQGILGCQETTRWMLGDVENDNETYTMEGGGKSALELLMDALDMAKGCHAEFDQTTVPWVLHLRQSSRTPKCECRMRRNLVSASIVQDDTELCTRVYAEGLPNGYMDAPTADQWGIIARRIDVDDEDTTEEIVRKAQSYLEDHQNPQISITLEAIELQRMTGEPIDSFAIGDMCLVCLPDEGLVLRERIVALSYGDLVSSPDKATLTLSTGLEDASSSISSLRKSTRDNSRSIRQNITEIGNTKAWVKVVDDKVEVVGRHIDLVAGDVDELNKLTSEVSIRLDAEKARLDLLAKRTDNAEERISKAEISLDGANGSISLLGEITDKQGERLSAAEIAIDGAKSQIELKANRIELQGYVKAEDLATETLQVINGATIGSLFVDDRLDTGYLVTGEVTANSVDTDTLTLGGSAVTGKNATVVTALQGLSLAFAYVIGEDGARKRVVTNVEINNPTRTTLNYLGM